MERTVKKIIIRFVILSLLAASLFILFRYSPLSEVINLRRIQESRDQLIGFVHSHYVPAVAVFILVYITTVALSIPGATVLSITAGFFFGPFLAVLYINIGATTGAFLVFLAARFVLGKSIQRRYSKQLARFNREIERNGSNYLLTLRLIPIFPFFLINLLAGFTNIKARTFLWTTALGIIPGSFVYAYLGHAGATVQPGESLLPPQVLIALVLLGVLSLIPVIVRKFTSHRIQKEPDEASEKPLAGNEEEKEKEKEEDSK